MKRFVSALLVFVLMGSIFASTNAGAKPSQNNKVEVCHRQGTKWKLLSISTNAVPAHLGHGDGLPLGAVPGQLGFEFDAACSPTPFSTVTVVGPEQGGEAGAIQLALDELRERTGVPALYVAAQDIGAVIDDAVATGGAPSIIDPATGQTLVVDIAIVPVPTAVTALAEAGAAVPASTQAAATATAGWPADFIEYGTVDGTLYAVPNKADLKSLVWYKPATFVDPGGTPYDVPETFTELLALTDLMIANGQTPWCVGIESGEATGFVFTDWVEDRVLGSSSTDFYDDWIANDVSFTDPSMKDVWADVLGLWNTPGAVFEGLGAPAPGVGIASTNFFGSVENLAFGDACLMHKQASFAGAIIGEPVVNDLATFPFPGNIPGSTATLGSGTFAVSFSDGIEAALVHEYFASADYADERQVALARLGGSTATSFLSAVQGQDLSVRTALEASFTQQLQNADPFRFDASDLMPPEIGASIFPGGFWGEGTQAVIGEGNVVDFGGGFIVPGKSIDDATQAIADLFCVIVPNGDACP